MHIGRLGFGLSGLGPMMMVVSFIAWWSLVSFGGLRHIRNNDDVRRFDCREVLWCFLVLDPGSGSGIESALARTFNLRV